MQVKLIVVGGKANKGEVAIQLPATIGRSRDADLTVGHRMISRKHCETYLTDGLMMIRDLGSLNGVYVRGRRVREAPLPPGEKFSIGPITFRVEYECSVDLSNLPPIVPADATAVEPPPEKQTRPVEPVSDEDRGPEEDSQALAAVGASDSEAEGEEVDFELIDDDDFELAVQESVQEPENDQAPKPAPSKKEPAKEEEPAEKDPEDQLFDDFLNDLQ
ncbi:MAG: FHA domain-containing protein [Pirellulaceae bacterium]|nr:FHA domain-containing protein [Pirellulaceae bacterium]